MPRIIYFLFIPLLPITLILGSWVIIAIGVGYVFWFINLLFIKKKLYTFHEYIQWVSEGW